MQYRFSVSEDTLRPEWAPIKIDRVKTNQIVIDLNYLKMGADKQSWFFTDPQIIIDLERDEEFLLIPLRDRVH